MAGTVSITYQTARAQGGLGVRKVTLAWTSDASGDVSGSPTTYLTGEILRVVIVPSGTAAPTTLYDVTLRSYGGDGIDLLAGQGANLSATVASHVKPGVPFKDGTTTATAPIAVDDQLELVVANAGNAKSGTVTLYLR